MQSIIELCNVSLANVGQDLSIMSLDEAGKSARMCRLHYPSVLETVLTSVDWVFAKKRAVLARLTEAPTFDYPYAFALPSNPKCLKVRAVRLDRVDRVYEIEGDCLLTDSETCKIIYTGLMTDPAQFPSMMTEAMVAGLSARLAKSVGNDASLAARFREELHNVILPEARKQNADQEPQAGEAGEVLWDEA